MPITYSQQSQKCPPPGIRAAARPLRCEVTANVTGDTMFSTQSTNSDAPSQCSPSTDNAAEVGSEAMVATIKHIVQDFLDQVSYRSPQTPQNPDMRREVAAEIVSWNDGLSHSFVSELTETCCAIAESAYKHTSYEHQFIVALYTTYLVYADDMGQHNVDAVGEFVQRFTRGQAQPNVAFDRLATLLGTLHEYYPRISADGIIINSLESLTGMYIELVTKGVPIHPAADRYPFYLRLKTGIACAYAHLNFTKSWGEATGQFYIQMLPEFELVIVGINDMHESSPFCDLQTLMLDVPHCSLSFYKETLAGETDNYVHMRAAAEQKQPLTVLQELADENVKSIRKIEKLCACQTGLGEIFHSFLMGYIEFHFNARRYHLGEAVDVARYMPA